MTSKEDQQYYEAANQAEIVESNLKSILTEVLCAEITQTGDFKMGILKCFDDLFY